MDCIFCKIAAGEMDANILYQDELILAFEDISPKAPTHTLIIPRKHIATTNDLQESDKELVGHMVLIAQKIAKENGIADDGYRLVLNCNRGAGQEVFHLHLHLLGGRAMNWPPG